MRFLMMLTTFALMGLCSSSPIDPERRLVNRPTKDQIFRGIRSAQVKQHGLVYVKGGVSRNPEMSLRKGEYMCGSKICKLQPGEIPEGCKDHVCQYPLRLDSPELHSQSEPVQFRSTN